VETSSSEDTVEAAIYVYIMDFWPWRRAVMYTVTKVPEKFLL